MSNPKIVLMIPCLSIWNMGKICQMVCYISDEKTCVFFPSERAVEGKQQRSRCAQKSLREGIQKTVLTCYLVCYFVKYAIVVYTEGTLVILLKKK